MTLSEALRLLLFYAFLVWFWVTMPAADRGATEFWKRLGWKWESPRWPNLVIHLGLVVLAVAATVIAVNAS